MRLITAIAFGLAMSATPLAAEHLYSDGHGVELQRNGVQGRAPVRNYSTAPDNRFAAPQRFGLTPERRTERHFRTGLDRPYGGHGVPYRTPPQGWPHPPF